MMKVQYAPFDLRLNTYSRDSDGIEHFVITVSDSPEGSLEGDTIAVQLESDIRLRIVALERGQLSEDELIKFGQQLGQLLFGGEIGRLLDKNVSRCATLDKYAPDVRHRLRIRLIISVPALASIPWEFAWVPRIGTVSEGFVALNESFSLVREETLSKSLQPLTPLDPDHVRMVALFSNPAKLPPGLEPLPLQAEREGIEQVVRKAWPEVELQLIPGDSVARATAANLRRLIQQGSGTHIFHYSGHGQFEKTGLGALGQPSQGRGNLVLDKGDGSFDFLSAKDLAQLLKGAGIRLAFLNACDVSKRDSTNYFTGIAPALQDADIPAIVGMQFTIKNSSATVFSEQFYHVLATTGSIDRAMWSARQQLYFENRTASEDRMHRDWGTPVLYLRAEGEGLLPVTAATLAQTNGGQSKAVDGIATLSEPIQQDVAATANSTGTKITVDPNTNKQNPRTDMSTKPVNKVALRNFIIKYFNAPGDMDTLCADLTQLLSDKGINEEVNMALVGGSNLTSQALNLIQYTERRGWLPHLVVAVTNSRPGLSIE